MHNKYHTDDGDKDIDDAPSLSRIRHIEENREDIDGQNGDERHLDRLGNDITELVKRLLEIGGLKERDAQSHHKGRDERAHHVKQRRYLDGKEGFEFLGRSYSLGGLAAIDERREDARAREITEETREHRVAIGNECRDQQQFTRTLTDIGNSRGHQPHDNQGDEERQEVTEHAVKGDETPDSPLREKHAAQYAHNDGDDDSWQETNFR